MFLQSALFSSALSFPRQGRPRTAPSSVVARLKLVALPADCHDGPTPRLNRSAQSHTAAPVALLQSDSLRGLAPPRFGAPVEMSVKTATSRSYNGPLPSGHGSGALGPASGSIIVSFVGLQLIPRTWPWLDWTWCIFCSSIGLPSGAPE